MVAISCSSKFWAFALAEQLQKEAMLDDFYTTYAQKKYAFLRRLIKRIDNEEIAVSKIHTSTWLAVPAKTFPAKSHIWNNLFDAWVAGRLKQSSSKIFIGWSGMSLNSFRSAKQKKMFTVLERGSSHILFQDRILRDEYRRLGRTFSIHAAVIKKELQEYQVADFIAIPSTFVKKSFVDAGISEHKLWVNPYGFSQYFTPVTAFNKNGRFIVVYFGTLSVRKGMRYLFDALEMLPFPQTDLEAWFIGNIEPEVEEEVDRRRHHSNWKFFGHINYYELGNYVKAASVAVFPSVEDGYGMVINQALACGIPAIATANTGGPDVIKDGINGFIVPACEAAPIADKLSLLFNDRELLYTLHLHAAPVVQDGFTWNDYGKRYTKKLRALPV